MTNKFLALAASAALTMVACADKTDSGDSGDVGGTSDTSGTNDTSSTSGGTDWVGASFTGQLDTYWLDGRDDDLIDQYAISGTGVACTGCDLAFDGSFTGSVSNFSATVEWAGGYVYGGTDYWGYGGVADGSAYIDSYGADTSYGYYGVVYY